MTTDRATDILCRNIGILESRQSAAEQQRAICVEELICRLCEDRDASAERLYRHLSELLPNHRDLDCARFCLTLAKSRALSLATAESEPIPTDSYGKIALVHNPYNQEAYRRFAKSVIGAKAYPVPSFSDACEDVFDNRCEFCILPIENSQDGRLFGFYGMLDRYELKICATVTLETDSPSGSIRYVLLGKKTPDRIPKDARWYLECTLLEEGGRFPSDLVSLSPLFGATLTKIDSLPVLYDDGLQRFYCTLSLPKESAAAFDLYLSLRHGGYTNIGYYPALIEPR